MNTHTPEDGTTTRFSFLQYAKTELRFSLCFLHTARGGKDLGTRLDNATAEGGARTIVRSAIVETSGGTMDLAMCLVLLVALGVTRAEYPFRNTSLPFDARVKASIFVHARSEVEIIYHPAPSFCIHTFNWPLVRTMAVKAVTFLLCQL